MRILILTADASSNSLVRLYPIAKVLSRRHQVTIAGFRSEETVFKPYSSEFEFDTTLTGSLPGFFGQVKRFARSFDTDLIYAFKPLSTSLWPALALRRRLQVPLMLDIEDWELGWYLDRRRIDQLKQARHLRAPNGMLWTAANERLVRRADHRLVVSRFLQRRFGGTLLRHGPDTDAFDPARCPRERALEQLGLPDADYVAFLGTAMANKGLEDLLAAIERVGGERTRLLLVGSHDHDPAYYHSLLQRWGRWITAVGPRPHSEMPLFLSAASVVALPQRVTRETTAQLPGKVFEAMAMARPVLATAVGDLPEILGGCGLIVPPDDPDALSAALGTLLGDAGVRERLGASARDHCVDHFSWDAMAAVLEGVLRSLN